MKVNAFSADSRDSNLVKVKPLKVGRFDWSAWPSGHLNGLQCQVKTHAVIAAHICSAQNHTHYQVGLHPDSPDIQFTHYPLRPDIADHTTLWFNSGWSTHTLRNSLWGGSMQSWSNFESSPAQTVKKNVHY